MPWPVESTPLYHRAGEEAEDGFLKRVMVAEDDPVYNRMLERCLEQRGFRVTCVTNGLDALKKARAPGSPRILILDWVMPHMYGTEVCRQLREQPSKGCYQYIVLLSANNSPQDIVAGLDSGADDYLTKPFDVHELVARIRVGVRMIKLQNSLCAAQERLRFQATHDPLTAIWNHGATLELLQAEAERAERNNASLTVLMVDIDHFKAVNDKLGHQAGDAVLREVAQRLGATVRGYDVLGRYGGEEFLIASQLEAEQVGPYAERLRDGIASAPFVTSAGELRISVSIGVAIKDAGVACELHDVIRSADEAMYLAKTNGRNRVEIAGVARSRPLSDESAQVPTRDALA